jgi:hypothetical protein
MHNIADVPGNVLEIPTAERRPRRGAWREVAARATRLLARYEAVLFAVMIVIQLTPIWAFTYLPTTDGAAHVANADVMRKYDDPALSVFRKYYVIAKDPTPNLVGHVLLAGFQYVASPTAAEKLLVSLYVMLLPLGVRYGLRSIRRSATPLAFLAFPLVYNYLFAQGFYNFGLSCAVFFIVVGYWARNRDRMDWRRGTVLGALGLVLYTCHLFSLVMACGVIGLLCGWFSIPELRSRAFRPAARRAIVTGLALLPVVVMAVLFKPSTQWHSDEVFEWQPKEDLVGLLQFRSLVSFREKEAWLGGAITTVVAALTLLALVTKASRRRAWSRWDVLLLVPVGLAGVYFKSYDARAMHFYIPQRTMLFIFLTMLLWLAGQPIARRVRWAVAPIAVALGLAFTASHAQKYREFKPQLADFVRAGDQVQRNSTFLPLIFSPRGRTLTGQVSSIDVSPFYMASGYIAVRRDAVDLRNYEANTDHFPVRFRDELNPYKHLAVGDGFNTVPPRIDIEGYRRKGGEVDYVIVWGLEEKFREHEHTRALYRQLEQGYERVDVEGVRQTELWKRRGL